MSTLMTDGTPADLRAKLAAAGPGDVVTIPAGEFHWESSVVESVAPGVTLKGGGSATAMGGGDQTIITDNISSGSPLLVVNVSPTGVFRMTGITFKSGTGAVKDGATVGINGPGTVRLDHLHFVMTSQSNYKSLVISSGVFGVLDHSILDLTGLNSIYVYNGRRLAGEIAGNYEWSLPTEFGGDKYFFIEDNIINGTVPEGATYSTRVFDGFTAAKVVVRFNDANQACLGETHGTGHFGDDRGLRSQEVYGNRVRASLVGGREPNFAALSIGNGTTLLWGNTWDQVYKTIYYINMVRRYVQTATPNGWGFPGKQWGGDGSMWDGGTALGTDTTLGYPCLDQPGRGQGDLLTGEFPNKVNSTTGTIRWPNQALEPIYIWNNAGGPVAGYGSIMYSNATDGRVVANRDYYPSAGGIQTSPNSPFDGTSGTGWGTLANRPTTCTPGVAYFVMDEGAWNKSASNPYGVQMNGASGVLYKCTAPNVWTKFYEPFEYPHPLIKETESGTTPTPDPVPIPEPEPEPDPLPVPPVGEAPVIVSSFSNMQIRKRSTVSLDVAATGPDLKYRWQKGTSLLAGQTGPTYTISNANPGDAATYTCTVSNPFGVKTASGRIAVLK